MRGSVHNQKNGDVLLTVPFRLYIIFFTFFFFLFFNQLSLCCAESTSVQQYFVCMYLLMPIIPCFLLCKVGLFLMCCGEQVGSTVTGRVWRSTACDGHSAGEGRETDACSVEGRWSTHMFMKPVCCAAADLTG